MAGSGHLPAIGIKETGSWVHAHSSIIICEKWLALKFASEPLARTKNPADNSVHITTRNLYIWSSGGNVNSPFWRLHIFSNLAFNEVFLNDFAYILNTSDSPKTPRTRPAISSQAEFENAHTNIQPFVVRTMCSIAETNVLVFPVPFGKKIVFSIFNCMMQHGDMQ